jgi:hypothetical protein
MYFPDSFAGLRALSEGVHRFVSRWAHRHINARCRLHEFPIRR